MSTPEEEFLGPRSNHPKYVLRYTVNGEDDRFAEGVARRRTRSFGAESAPRLDIDYDRSRHVIQIAQEGEKKSEFDDRPARLLFMECDPVTGKMKPAMDWGNPVYYYLAREVEGGAPGMRSANTE